MSIRLLALLATLTLAAVACTGDAGDGAVAAESVATPAADAAGAGGGQRPVTAFAGTSPLGDILVGDDGRTLYGFTNDTEAASTCYGTCAEAWPPVIVAPDWTVGPELDTGIFATTVRDDGALQLVAGKWPLYFFAGDAIPGDLNGQGSGAVWFAVDLDGRLITDEADAADQPDPAESASTDDAAAPAAAPVTVGTTELGDALIDDAGLTLYGFLTDVDGDPTCNDACADAWPPVFVDGAELPAGLDPAVFSVVVRDDGSHQLKAGRWPLYRFAGDAAPGDVNGQGSGDVWFVSAPDGSLIGAPSMSGDAGVADQGGDDDASEGY